MKLLSKIKYFTAIRKELVYLGSGDNKDYYMDVNDIKYLYYVLDGDGVAYSIRMPDESLCAAVEKARKLQILK
jgi:hypothetical protein